jgi:hypothetical protein
VNLENGTSSITWHETPVVTDYRPIAHDDSVIVDEDASVAIILSGSDADGNTSTPLTYRVGVQPANGTLSGTAPDLTYTPDVNFFGSDRFYFLVNNGEANSYAAEVSITVNPIPDVPVATAQSIIVYKDEPSVITLSGTDADGDILTTALESQPVNGWLSGTAPSLTYTPDAGYVGVDGFSFTVNDGLYNSVPATVSIWVSQDVTDVIAAYDFDDGVGNATTAVSLKDANVSASDYGVGVGLNNVINTSSGLAEDKDAEGNNFGTANPLSYGGIRDDFGFTRQGSLSGAITTDEYMTFTVTPTNSASMNLSRFTFRHFANNLTESATSWALYSSVDGFDQADAIATGETTVAADWVGHVIDLPAKSFRGLNQAVEFRLYIYDGRNNSNSLTLFDKVILHGSVADSLNR